MVNFILIFLCIGAGMLLRSSRMVPDHAHKGINAWIINIALPAVSFKYLPLISWSTQMLFPVLAAVVIWIGSWLTMEWYCRYKGYAQRSRSTMELASGYSNTSFIGFPLIAAFFGEQYLSIAIICDQTMFLLLSTAGIVAALRGGKTAEQQVSVRYIVRRLCTFPPFIACVLALLIGPFINQLSFAAPLFDKLAATVAPLALFSVGLQLKFTGWRQASAQISVVLLYKLILAPILILALAIWMGISPDIGKISVFEAAMPTVITSSMIAEQFRLNTRLINLIIGIGILIGLLSSAIWVFILQLVYA